MTRDRALMILFMTILIGLTLSAIFTWQSQGLSAGFVGAWMGRFSSTYVIVLPTVIIVSPIAQWLSSRIDRLFGPVASPLTVARAAWEANASGHAGNGFEAWLNMLAPDVVVSMPIGAFRGETRGKSDVAKIYLAIMQANPQLTYEEPLRVTTTGDSVVFEFEDHGTIAGLPYTNRIAASFDIKDGKVAAYREYFGDIDPAIVATMSGASNSKKLENAS
jgi:ketosteroid isomerase-like protein